jgi:glycosyltransferase involved in cell wall biosynthesis
VATPGVDMAELAPGSETAGSLLCVATVVPGKGQDVLLDALETISSLSWHCRLVGSLDRDPAFAQALARRIADGRLNGRVSLTGTLGDADLDSSYAAADLFVLASRAETFGMVVTEALARGVPVVASDVGGVPEALGRCAQDSAPGLLVPPDEPAALAAALRSWLGDAELRRRLRRAARERRAALTRWPATTAIVARVLSEAAAQ